MLKRIDAAEVQLGMFIHKLEGSWFKHPFWKSRFLLNDADMLQSLRHSDVAGIIIDTGKGADVSARQANSALRPAAPAPSQAVTRPAGRPARVAGPVVRQPFDLRSTTRAGMAREFGHAGKIADRGRKLVGQVFLEMRLGKSIKTRHVEPVIEEIFASVQRNPHAFNGLMRCKRDNEYIYRHAIAISALMISLARTMKFSPEQIREAGMAGLLMDVGIGHLPVDLTQLGGDYRNLDPAILEQHVPLGHEFLRAGGGIPDDVLAVTRNHHERIDGTGYPRGVKGPEIDTLSRMAAICDFYDSLVSDTAEGTGMNPASALQQMAVMTGWFDRAILKSFIETMGMHPIGSVVRLCSGRLAMVVDQDPSDYSRPKVRCFYSTQTGRFVQPSDIELAHCYGEDEIEAVADPTDYGIEDFAKLREHLFAAASKAA